MPIISKTTTYEYSPDNIKELLAAELQVPKERLEVQFIIQEVGGDPMDRFPGTKQVTSIRATVRG